MNLILKGYWSNNPISVDEVIQNPELVLRVPVGTVSLTDVDKAYVDEQDSLLGNEFTTALQALVGNTLALGETSTTAHPGDKGKIAYDHVTDLNNPHQTTKAHVGLSNVTNDAQLKISANLSDVSDASVARTNLGLGDSAVKNVGTSSGTVASGDHTHTALYEPANPNIQAHISNTANPHGTTKGQVGLGNADNTADADKPISTAQAAALAMKEPTITATGVTTDYYGGDKAFHPLTKAVVGLSNVPNVDATSRSNHTGTQTATTISDFDTAATALANSAISLRITDTISDGVTDKAPTQNAVFDALTLKSNVGHIHTVSEVINYNTVTDAKIDTAIAAVTLTSLPDVSDATPTTDQYLKYDGMLWSPSTLVGGGVALGETSSTAYRGDNGKIAYDHSLSQGNPHNTTTSDINEGTKLFFTESRVNQTVLTGLNTSTATPALATDQLLAAIGKLQAQINNPPQPTWVNVTTLAGYIASSVDQGNSKIEVSKQNGMIWIRGYFVLSGTVSAGSPIVRYTQTSYLVDSTYTTGAANISPLSMSAVMLMTPSSGGLGTISYLKFNPSRVAGNSINFTLSPYPTSLVAQGYFIVPTCLGKALNP